MVGKVTCVLFLIIEQITSYLKKRTKGNMFLKILIVIMFQKWNNTLEIINIASLEYESFANQVYMYIRGVLYHKQMTE